MSVHLMSTPVTNSSPFLLRLLPLNQNLGPGDAAVVTGVFDSIRVNGVRLLDVQNPPGDFNVDPGNLGYFASSGNDIKFSFGPPKGQQQSVVFSEAIPQPD